MPVIVSVTAAKALPKQIPLLQQYVSVMQMVIQGV